MKTLYSGTTLLRGLSRGEKLGYRNIKCCEGRVRQVILLVRSLGEGRLSLFFPSEYQQKNVKNTVENKVPDNGLEATILRFKFSPKNV